MKIVVVGGGPAGLYLALLLRRADPRRRVVVLERNAPDDTYGWGVVFSDQTLGNLEQADPESFRAIEASFVHWDEIDVHVRGTTIRSGGHGFAGIGRARLLEILRRRAGELGVEIRWETEIRSDADLPALGLGDADLVVAADGVRSALREQYARTFQPDLDVRGARYVWLGTPKLFDAFTFAFVEEGDGVFQAHAYRFDADTSAFIVECDARSWRAAGMEGADEPATVAFCERLFAPWLDGQPLISRASHLESPWVRFVRVSCERWWTDEGEVAPVVLIGDAAHTAHFSIGSGTKLAMEDAIALSRRLHHAGDLPDALAAYEAERRTDALRLQNAARNSMEWFENVRRYVDLPPRQFAYSLLTRSQRVSHENLRLRDADWLEETERWFAEHAVRSVEAEEETRVDAISAEATEATRAVSPPPELGDTRGQVLGEGAAPRDTAGGSTEAAASATEDATRPVPPMFTPLRLRGMTLANRVVVSPMDMYSAVDGTPNDFHLVHLGGRALGGAGLVMTEMTCVSPEGRITLGCTGMYMEEHRKAWRRVVDFVHRRSEAKICLQLGHSGRKGATRLMWEGMDEPLPEEQAWETIGPSAVPHAPGMRPPRAMTRAEMDRVRDEHVRAARMAADAGFDMIELHAAHGYLLSSFITPLANHRTDEYGGPLENRLRYPLEVFRAMREAWPAERPMSVRISATDWVDEGGIRGEDAVRIARAFGEAGCDVIHVSTGQTSPDAKPVYGRMFQTPYSDRIRNEAGVRTIAVGNITEPDQVNAIIAAGRADLCALARPHLSDPHWTLHAAAELEWEGQWWPVQYLSGRDQLRRQVARRKAQEAEPEMLGTSTI